MSTISWRKKFKPELNCECGAKTKNTSKYRARFNRRHPSKPPEAVAEHLEQVKRGNIRRHKLSAGEKVDE